ncbi:helix-turn-helix domain-containing protein [Saccharopolyspora endophytica]|uniref:Helix-turn-helix transcriptional regulator n=1 Tax=Saccharopolyspora endophytica TaxID=543886 RepID=A0ABS5DQR3_9PSEU|nr:helix-turn-helix transcriptional regulator [Saccharopolyspora endophytica]MBQ0928607.1 helix-turn-helix transcriptional regulator [Saccharopolyspora endophytica]
MVRRRHDLAERRRSRGYSRESLAAELGVSPDAVRDWERAKWDPAPRRRPALAQALGWTLDQLDEALDVSDIELVQGPASADDRVWARNVDPDHVLSYFAEQWHALVKADNVVGPSHALHGVQQNIPLLTTLIDHGPQDARQRALRLAAQYAESASWLHEDLGDLFTARHWAEQALHLARTGGDRDLVTWTHYRRAQQTLPTTSSRAAPQTAHRVLERLARAHDEGEPQASMRAALDAQHALALGTLGHETSAHRMLDRAHDYAEDHDAGDARSGHGAFATANWVALQRAWCWTVTGRPRKAAALFDASLEQLSSVYQRDRAAHLVRYAITLREAGRIDAAADQARTAWGLARAVSSGRCAAEVRAVAESLRPHRRVPEVAELIAAVTVTGEK